MCVCSLLPDLYKETYMKKLFFEGLFDTAAEELVDAEVSIGKLLGVLNSYDSGKEYAPNQKCKARIGSGALEITLPGRGVSVRAVSSKGGELGLTRRDCEALVEFMSETGIRKINFKPGGCEKITLYDEEQKGQGIDLGVGTEIESVAIDLIGGLHSGLGRIPGFVSESPLAIKTDFLSVFIGPKTDIKEIKILGGLRRLELRWSEESDWMLPEQASWLRKIRIEELVLSHNRRSVSKALSAGLKGKRSITNEQLEDLLEMQIGNNIGSITLLLDTADNARYASEMSVSLTRSGQKWLIRRGDDRTRGFRGV